MSLTGWVSVDVLQIFHLTTALIICDGNGTRQSISLMGQHSFEVLAWVFVCSEDIVYSVSPSPVISTLFH